MKIADYEKVKLLVDNRIGLECILKITSQTHQDPSASLKNISLRSVNGVLVETSVRESTLKTFLQGELKEVDKGLKALGVVL